MYYIYNIMICVSVYSHIGTFVGHIFTHKQCIKVTSYSLRNYIILLVTNKIFA